jgi:hypothetical protein
MGLDLKGNCYTYEVLKKICIKVDFVKDVTGNEILQYNGGCFPNGESYIMEKATPNKVYDFGGITIETRKSTDPYTVIAKNEYNMGTDLSYFAWLATIFLLLSLSGCCVVGTSYGVLLKEGAIFRHRPNARRQIFGED